MGVRARGARGGGVGGGGYAHPRPHGLGLRAGARQQLGQATPAPFLPLHWPPPGAPQALLSACGPPSRLCLGESRRQCLGHVCARERREVRGFAAPECRSGGEGGLGGWPRQNCGGWGPDGGAEAGTAKSSGGVHALLLLAWGCLGGRWGGGSDCRCMVAERGPMSGWASHRLQMYFRPMFWTCSKMFITLAWVAA